MKLSVRRSRLQYDSSMNYEKPLIIEIEATASVTRLKEEIYDRQRKLSIGEETRCQPYESQPVVSTGDQVLVIHKFRDPHLRGVILDDNKRLSDYGLSDRLETNLFLRRLHSRQSFVADILLIDFKVLTPNQRTRLAECLSKPDHKGLQHCIQQ